MHSEIQLNEFQTINFWEEETRKWKEDPIFGLITEKVLNT